MTQFVLGALGEGEAMTYISSPGVEFGAAVGRRGMDSKETQEVAALPEQYKSNMQLRLHSPLYPRPSSFCFIQSSLLSSFSFPYAFREEKQILIFSYKSD